MPFAMPPGLRLPYDSDGSIVLVHSDPQAPSGYMGNMLEASQAALSAMNSTFGGGIYVPSPVWYPSYPGLGFWWPNSTVDINSYPYVSVLFPIPTRLRGIFLLASSVSQFRIETSVNTTNGIDGTWVFSTNYTFGATPKQSTSLGTTPAVDLVTGVSSLYPGLRIPKDYYRLLANTDGFGILPLNGVETRNVKGIRVYPMPYDDNGGSTAAPTSFLMHLYGEPDSDAIGSDYLQAWRSDMDMRLGGATLNWEDVPLSSSSDKQFRIKNQSSSHTANNVVISASDLMFYPTPSPAAQFTFSLDGVTWTSSVTISAIGPGTVSSVIYIRRVTPANAVLTTWSPKLNFVVGSWT